MVMLTIGLNYRTAPIAVREKLAFDAEGSLSVLKKLVDGKTIKEAVVLPTCNRTEFYIESEDNSLILNDENYIPQYLDYLKAKIVQPYFEKDVPIQNINECTYIHFGLNTIKHLMRVVSGLDSMVLGEVEIVAQVKKAYNLANQLGVVGKYLARLFETSFNVAKTVRSTTEISHHPISIAYAAVKLSTHIFTHLADSSVLLIGAGDLIQTTAKHLKECGVKNIWIANRTQSRAQALAHCVDGQVIGFEEIPEKLYQIDILITGVESTLPIIGKGMIERAVKRRKHKPMYMVDLGLPRNIEPEVSELEDVFLYCLDDLQLIVADNRRLRQNAALSAEKIIQNEAEKLMDWFNAQDALKTLCAFRQKCEELRDQVLREGLQKLKTGDNAERVLRRMLYSLTNRFMHLPTRRLREASFEQEKQLLNLTKDLFELHHEKVDTE